MPAADSRPGPTGRPAKITAPQFPVVIFDNDGVLVDSEPLANEILSSLLAESGLDLTVEQCVAEFLGATLARVRRQVAGRVTSPLPDDFEARYQTRVLAEFSGSLRPVAGVVDLLRALHGAGVGLCVASSGTRERIRVALETTGLARWFGDRVVSADDVGRGKPFPDLFLRAASVAGAAPEECAVVEDSPLGIEAAVAAGMTAFGYAARTGPKRLAGARGGVVTDMAALGALLGVCVAPPR